jgi:hypothetical protein
MAVGRLFAIDELLMGDRSASEERSIEALSDAELSHSLSIEKFKAEAIMKKPHLVLLGRWKAPIASHKLPGMRGATGAKLLQTQGYPHGGNPE